MANMLSYILLAVMILLSVHPAAHAFKLPDTGQTASYGSGDDGSYQINPMSYADNGNGTVTDNNTGLMWQKCSAGQNNDSTCSGSASTYNWYQASGTLDATYNPSLQNVCGVLTLGIYSDWRLPTKQELISIVDYSVYSPGPTLKTEYFPNSIKGDYWSSTTLAGYPDKAWSIYYGNGSINNWGKIYPMGIRCVRGGQRAPDLFDNGDGTVTDNRTGLMWQKGEAGVMSWGEAIGQCNTLILPPFNGYTDWRLPNIKELESLVDDTRYGPAIDTAYFPNATSAEYWSSTSDTVNLCYGAWYVHFGDGSAVGLAKLFSFNVHCVRAGESGSVDNFIRLMRGSSPVNYFATIQGAYNTAHEGDTIQGQAMDFAETVSFASNVAVSVSGGFNNGFTANPGYTTINGTINIEKGTVTMEKLIIE
jgi:hypothetical protein